MAQSGSSSFLANMKARKRGLAQVREGLLDRPGIARRGGPPPPTAPAQNRTSPQEQAIRQGRTEQQSQQARIESKPAEAPATANQAIQGVGLDEGTKEELLTQIRPFLQQARAERRARLHTTLGRTRRFFGGGI